MKFVNPTSISRAIAVAMLLLATSAHAAQGLYHAPERDGHGVVITADMGAGHAVIWHLYRRDRSSAFLIGADNCETFPCVTALHEPSARWMGGDLDLGPEIGSVELHPTEDGLKAVYDLRAFDPDACFTGPGGVLLNQCVGTIELQLLAR